jgi:RHS repeat-associated protein
MLMPGRHGYAAQSGWAVGGNGSSLPASLSINSRSGNEPSVYKASESIEFTEGFESVEADEFEAYITDEGSGGGTVNGVDGEEGLYRYGFNGKENDNEVKGDGNQQDYGMRIYDPRLGRFLSVDPITAEYSELTPYQFASNSPIFGIDKDGLELFGNNWLFDIWLEWKFGDPTGAKKLMSGATQKAMVETKQMPYHNDKVFCTRPE